jgi:hypothetical protein
MNEQELRNIVREAVERHLVRPEKMGQEFSRPALSGHALSGHASHVILRVVPGSEIDEGTCLIEPSVRCNHCGFCQSYGH